MAGKKETCSLIAGKRLKMARFDIFGLTQNDLVEGNSGLAARNAGLRKNGDRFSENSRLSKPCACGKIREFRKAESGILPCVSMQNRKFSQIPALQTISSVNSSGRQTGAAVFLRIQRTVY